MSNIQKSFGKGSGNIFASVVNHIINISRYNFLACSRFKKKKKKKDHEKKFWLKFKTLIIINGSIGKK